MSNRTFNQLVAQAQADVEAGRTPDYSKLFDDAVADVELGIKHACRTTEHCQEMGGCPRCFQGLMKGDLGIVAVDVFKSGVIRVTTVGHGGQPCVVSFRNVTVKIHGGSHGETKIGELSTECNNRGSGSGGHRADVGCLVGVQ